MSWRQSGDRPAPISGPAGYWVICDIRSEQSDPVSRHARPDDALRIYTFQPCKDAPAATDGIGAAGAFSRSCMPAAAALAWTAHGPDSVENSDLRQRWREGRQCAFPQKKPAWSDPARSVIPAKRGMPGERRHFASVPPRSPGIPAIRQALDAPKPGCRSSRVP